MASLASVPKADRRLRVALFLMAALVAAAPAEAFQQTLPCYTVSQPPLRVFLDCNQCDTDFVVTNVAFVDYVRDRAVADLHILVTTQSTGGGGQQWTVKFIGLGRFAGHDHEMTYSTPSTFSGDQSRTEFARIFRLGLVGYAADTSANAQLNVTWTKPEGGAKAAPTKDPWNFWVFRVNVGGNFNGEESTTSHSLRFNTRASRTTDRWKISIETNNNVDKSSYKIDENETIKSSRSEWGFNGLVVKSAGPHWSFGARSSFSHSSYSNENRLFRFQPGIEYDVFPYTESTRRILTFMYSAGVTYRTYAETTIFDKLKETIPEHSLTASLGLRQPWGSLNASGGLTQQMNMLSRYRLSVFSEASVRLFNGFEINFYAGYDRIRNLISLRKDEASTSDILLRIQQLATGYSYFGGFNISYSFGSIFNNIVNPRFDR